MCFSVPTVNLATCAADNNKTTKVFSRCEMG